jgi:predicted AlkP superfamily phosphohydrolase/phosphomutase
VVLSIDGVPFTLLARLVQDGELPAFARLIQEADFRQMDSVQPTVSSVAWTCFATGRNPGKHGVYGFVDRDPAGYDITIPLSTTIRGKTVWEVLSDAGKRVFGMNVPLSYPPRSVNGILIGGFLCPDVGKAAFPAEVNGYLRSIGYRIDSDPMLARQSREAMVPDLHETLDRRMEAMFHFLDQEQWHWDYFHTHVMVTDRLHHFLLKDYEEGHPVFREEFLRLYRRIDAYLGELMEVLPEEATLIVLSDHGFCAMRAEVQLSRWLIERGWTAPAPGQPGGPLDIDPSQSRAYTLIPGRLHLNLEGREPGGIVPRDRYFEVRQELASDLLSMRAPDGEPVIREVQLREEVYWPGGRHGPDAESALKELLRTDRPFGLGPDLIAVPHDGYDLKMGLAAPEVFRTTELQGMHTFDDALIIARGLELPTERLGVTALTPHLLAALGVDPPAEMD